MASYDEPKGETNNDGKMTNNDRRVGNLRPAITMIEAWPDHQSEHADEVDGAGSFLRRLAFRRRTGRLKVPARSTIHAVLDLNGLVNRMRRRRNKAPACAYPNDPRCADFKGEFTLGNRCYYYPLTAGNHAVAASKMGRTRLKGQQLKKPSTAQP